MENRQEILKALELIKGICQKQENCDKCPFGTHDCYCILKDRIPEEWQLNDTESLWRAFK